MTLISGVVTPVATLFRPYSRTHQPCSRSSSTNSGYAACALCLIAKLSGPKGSILPPVELIAMLDDTYSLGLHPITSSLFSLLHPDHTHIHGCSPRGMADPEIELPLSPEQMRVRNEGPGISELPKSSGISPRGSADPTSGTAPNTEDELDEKNDSDETLESEEEEPGEIVWHYLTYATEIPRPTSTCPTRDGQPPPEPPDLKKYTSPFDWPDTRKNLTIYIACFITALTAFSAGSYSPGVAQMTEEWHISSVAAFVGITTFTCGKNLPIPSFLCNSSLTNPRLRRSSHGPRPLLRDLRSPPRLHRLRNPLRDLPALHGAHAILRRHARRPLLHGGGRLDLLYHGRRRRLRHLPHRRPQHAHGPLLGRRPLRHRLGPLGLRLHRAEHILALDLLRTSHGQRPRRGSHLRHLQRNPRQRVTLSESARPKQVLRHPRIPGVHHSPPSHPHI